MHKLFYILLIASAFAACGRHTIPAVNNSDSTLIVKKDSVVTKDTTVAFPAIIIRTSVNVDSLLKIIDSLKKADADTGAYFPYIHIIDSSLSGSIDVSSSGDIKFTCKEDSLKAVIRNLTTAYLQLYVSKQKTQVEQVPGPIQIVNHIPSWCWYLLAFMIVYFGLKIVANFVTPQNSILKTLLNLFKK